MIVDVLRERLVAVLVVEFGESAEVSLKSRCSLSGPANACRPQAPVFETAVRAASSVFELP